MLNKVKISIITVCYNAETTILETIRSVFEQTYDNIEYIIVDGKSTDATMSIINDYFADKDFNVKILSERDSGIYEAMNKGIDMASGDWINFMNSGDKFVSCDTVKDVFLHVQTADVIYGDCINESQGFYKLYKADGVNSLPYKMIACHQCILCRRELMLQFKFDCSYKILADFDFIVKVFLCKKYHFVYVHLPICVYDITGISSNMKLAYSEKLKLYERNGIKHNGVKERLTYVKMRLKRFAKSFIVKIIPKMVYSQKRGWYSSVESLKERYSSNIL